MPHDGPSRNPLCHCVQLKACRIGKVGEIEIDIAVAIDILQRASISPASRGWMAMETSHPCHWNAVSLKLDDPAGASRSSQPPGCNGLQSLLNVIGR